MTNYYDILGVSCDADRASIMAAYHALALKWHPDRHIGESPKDVAYAEKMFKRISEAWSVLGVPELREEYDACLGVDFYNAGDDGHDYVALRPDRKTALKLRIKFAAGSIWSVTKTVLYLLFLPFILPVVFGEGRKPFLENFRDELAYLAVMAFIIFRLGGGISTPDKERSSLSENHIPSVAVKPEIHSDNEHNSSEPLADMRWYTLEKCGKARTVWLHSKDHSYRTEHLIFEPRSVEFSGDRTVVTWKVTNFSDRSIGVPVDGMSLIAWAHEGIGRICHPVSCSITVGERFVLRRDSDITFTVTYFPCLGAERMRFSMAYPEESFRCE